MGPQRNNDWSAIIAARTRCDGKKSIVIPVVQDLIDDDASAKN